MIVRLKNSAKIAGVKFPGGSSVEVSDEVAGQLFAANAADAVQPISPEPEPEQYPDLGASDQDDDNLPDGDEKPTGKKKGKKK